MAENKAFPAQGQLIGNAILTAALSMPCLQAAHADNLPEHGLVSYKYLDYQDSQPGEDRIGVKAHSIMVMAPFAGRWMIQGSATVDAVSGASPRLWTMSSASMRDRRNAEDVSLTRYFPNDTLTVGANLSDENDYTSRGISLGGTHVSDDRNTTFHYGVGANDDHITAQGLDRKKNTVGVMVGVTQVFTPRDIGQFTVTHTNGHGFFTDPYKLADFRPNERLQSTVMLRWNHFFEGSEGTLRLNYRYYTDSWEIRAHSLGAEYVQPFPQGWTLTPSFRVHDQSAAQFFVEPGGVPAGLPYRSFDQRISAYGALTLGIKVAKELDANWTWDMKYELYEQRGSWRLLGEGSSGLAPFRARILQLGLSRKF